MADLHTAAKEGDTSTIIQAIGRGDDINARDKHQRTALHLAAWAGQADVVKLLLAKEGCNVNAAAMDDVNALHFAAQKGHTDVVRQLLNAGLHVNSRTRKGMTALHFAAQNGHMETVQLLLSRKANIQATTGKQQTAYQLAKDQTIKSVLHAAAEEAAARLAAAVEERPDNETRRQRNAQRRRGKHGRTDTEETEPVEDTAGPDDLDPPTSIGPALPPGKLRKVEKIKEDGAGKVGADEDVDQGTNAEQATGVSIGPAGPPPGYKRQRTEARDTHNEAAAEVEGGIDDGGDGDGDDDDDHSSGGEDDDSGDDDEDLQAGVLIGPVGPPVGFDRKVPEAVNDAGGASKTPKVVAAALQSSKHAGKIVDARMVLSFMGDDEDED